MHIMIISNLLCFRCNKTPERDQTSFASVQAKRDIARPSSLFTQWYLNAQFWHLNNISQSRKFVNIISDLTKKAGSGSDHVSRVEGPDPLILYPFSGVYLMQNTLDEKYLGKQ